MKKFFLFVAVVATLSLTSCGGGNASSEPDGNSQVTSVDPNDPNQKPPQMDEASAVEQSVSMPTEQNVPEGEAQPTEQSKPAEQ